LFIFIRTPTRTLAHMFTQDEEEGDLRAPTSLPAAENKGQEEAQQEGAAKQHLNVKVRVSKFVHQYVC
jgi:hypothetical protein